MLRVALINMPFAAAQLPSIALTQLKSVVEASEDTPATVDIFYFNLDFTRFLGPSTYRLMSDSVEANTAGLGEWFFRQMAFPELEDNTELYLLRHFSANRALLDRLEKEVVPRRAEAERLLDQLIELHALDSYDVVGLTSMFSQNMASFAVARKVKKRNPRVVTLMGGANCESPMGQVIARNVASLDFVFSGTSLKSFPRFIAKLAKGEEDDCHRIGGVLSKRKLAFAMSSDAPEVGEELDINVEIPLNYDGYFSDLEAKGLADCFEPNVMFETSRGCWWGERSHCTFCGLNGRTMNYRAMAPEKALNQFNRLFQRYSWRTRIFQAVDNILPREYFAEVLPYLKPPENVSIFYEIKADIKEWEARTLAEAGINRLQPGIEALATSTLKLMHKGTTAFQNLRFLDYCLRFGIEPVWNLLIGFPGEEEEVYAKYVEDLPKLVHLPPPTGVYPVRFDRFSPYFTKSEEYGLDLAPCDFYGMIYPFDARDLPRLAYYFTDQNFAAPFAVGAAKWLDKLRAGVGYWHRRWFQRDGAVKPELRLLETDEGAVVIDSRDGERRVVALSQIGHEVLEALTAQTNLRRLGKKLPTHSKRKIDQEIENLLQEGYLFQEGEVLMSVVVMPEESRQEADLSVDPTFIASEPSTQVNIARAPNAAASRH